MGIETVLSLHQQINNQRLLLLHLFGPFIFVPFIKDIWIVPAFPLHYGIISSADFFPQRTIF